MPVIHESAYQPKALHLRSGHLQTLTPVLLRPRPEVDFQRTRLELDDGDFLDLDWSPAPGEGGRLALVIHGLEGHSRRKYVRGMVRALNAAGWDCVAMNHRGCSGEMNRLPRFYHSGETDDVHAALTHALDRGGYERAALVGFSMGANQILKYLGEDPGRLPKELAAAVSVSAPCALDACCRVLETGFAQVYQAYLLRSLKAKVRAKHALFPDSLSLAGLAGMRTFRQFDDTYTAPLAGYADASDYYARCSSLQFLDSIRTPVLVLNAKDDPFLAPECYPREQALASAWIYLETPESGGHVGFALNGASGPYWDERRAVEFLAPFA
ncbi:hydrolase [Desulfocurvus sp. DL9XJH121]